MASLFFTAIIVCCLVGIAQALCKFPEKIQNETFNMGGGRTIKFGPSDYEYLGIGRIMKLKCEGRHENFFYSRYKHGNVLMFFCVKILVGFSNIVVLRDYSMEKTWPQETVPSFETVCNITRVLSPHRMYAAIQLGAEGRLESEQCPREVTGVLTYTPSPVARYNVSGVTRATTQLVSCYDTIYVASHRGHFSQADRTLRPMKCITASNSSGVLASLLVYDPDTLVPGCVVYKNQADPGDSIVRYTYHEGFCLKNQTDEWVPTVSGGVSMKLTKVAASCVSATTITNGGGHLHPLLTSHSWLQLFIHSIFIFGFSLLVFVSCVVL